MKSKKTILLILIMVVSLIPNVRAITPQSQTIRITDTHDDMFITEVGIGIDSSLVTIKDPGMDIRSFLVFREIDVNFWEPLKNATLRLHTSNTLDFDADSSITIYGMALSDLQVEGWLLPSTVLSLGFTNARTNYNTSEFYGGQWHEINVTDIVEELIRDPNWDGDGHAGTETGDAIGFHIVGAEGDDKRYFYDFSVGNGLEAQLVIHWNHEPPPPAGLPDGSEYVGEYGDYSIWSYTPSETWFNFSTFGQYGASPKESGINDTYFYVTNMYADSDSYLRRDFDSYRDDSNPIINVKFGLNVVNIPWSVADAYVNLWSVSQDIDHAFDYDKGFTFTIRVRADRCMFYAWAVDSELIVDSLVYGPTIMESELSKIKYFNITLNMETLTVVSNVYEDFDMTILNGTWSDTFSSGPTWAGGSWLTYEYVNGPTEAATSNTGYSGAHLSQIEELDSTIFVYDPDEDILYEVGDEDGDGDIDQDDAEIFIELLDPDPQDPNPGDTWQETGPFTRFRTRLYILLLGFGLLFGPLIYFAMSRPSGYEFVIGLFIMLVGYSFLRAAAGI